MLIIDQLRISDDASRMYINVHVNTASYFQDITLDSITIMTADQVSETDPEVPTENYIYHREFVDGLKEAGLVLTPSDFIKQWESDPKAMMFQRDDMSKTLFFVYIKCKGVPDECTPCRLDEMTTLGVTFDENMLYQVVMDFTKGLSDDCNIPVGFTDFILLWNAFKAAIETEHYIPAIKFFNMLFGGYIEEGPSMSFSRTVKPCRCHG